MPFVGASPSSTLRMLEYTLAHAHGHTYTHLLMHTDTLSQIHKHTVTYKLTHTHSCTTSTLWLLKHTRTYTILTQARTQSTPTTPGWWTTSAYPSLRPCPWRGCRLPPGCTATMSSCLPLCHPLLKCVVTIRLFLHRQLPSHQPGTSSSSLHRGLIKWCGVIFQAHWEYSHGSGQDFTWWVLLSYCENIIDYLVLATLSPTGLWDICPCCPPSWLCPVIPAFLPLHYTCHHPKENQRNIF